MPFFNVLVLQQLNTLMDKNSLPLAEQIEYYLGKDRLPNLHWQSKIPNAWDIPPRDSGMILCNPDAHNVILTLDNIEYQLNNLGYRANFDYDISTLQTKNIVLLLGDSDTFARGTEFNEMYATKLQSATDNCIVNLGVPGISSDGMTRIGVQTILALGPAIKHVCILWPISSLREFVSKGFKSGVHTHSKNLPYANWWDHIDWVSNNYNYQKNKLMLEQTVANVGAKYHDLIINRYDKTTPTTYTRLENNTWTEFDSTTHTAIANYFLRKIQGKPSLYQELTQS